VLCHTQVVCVSSRCFTLAGVELHEKQYISILNLKSSEFFLSACDITVRNTVS